MHHVAIMNKSWKLIPKIISGEKTIESRWYKTKRAPWDGVRQGDIIYFKNSGEAITARADVEKVLQFECTSQGVIKNIIRTYGKKICLVNADFKTWKVKPRYCVLVALKNPKVVEKPFIINKKGFGIGAAWITVSNIKKILVH